MLCTIFFRFCYFTYPGQIPCTSGFPNLTTPVGSSRSFGTTRIIPEMKISCNGTTTSWTLAGRSVTSTNGAYPLLKVFRETSSGSGVYSFIDQIDLGKCGSDIAQRNEDNFFTCNLTENNRLSIQQNDIIGIFSPQAENQAAFEIFYTTTSVINYI